MKLKKRRQEKFKKKVTWKYYYKEKDKCFEKKVILDDIFHLLDILVHVLFSTIKKAVNLLLRFIR